MKTSAQKFAELGVQLVIVDMGNYEITRGVDPVTHIGLAPREDARIHRDIAVKGFYQTGKWLVIPEYRRAAHRVL